MKPIKINNSIFLDYLSCNYKAYLKINGLIGKKTDYEIIQNKLCLSKKHGKDLHQHKIIIFLAEKI